jgi:hypothetical protein
MDASNLEELAHIIQTDRPTQSEHHLALTLEAWRAQSVKPVSVSYCHRLAFTTVPQSIQLEVIWSVLRVDGRRADVTLLRPSLDPGVDTGGSSVFLLDLVSQIAE